jgi:hypothetical protein
LGFLEAGRFAAKIPENDYWILLDFLGFSRQNRDFSMGYADLGRKIFLASFSARDEWNVRVEAMRKGGICSCGKTSLISDFRQSIAVRRKMLPGPFRHTIPTMSS